MSALQLRIMAALGALVVAVIFFTGFLAERGLREREIARLEATLSERASLVREVLGGLPLSGASVPRLDGIADRLGAVTDGRVTLIARDGTVLGDSEVPEASLLNLENHASRPEVIKALAGKVGSDERYSQTLKRPLIYLALPAQETARPEGVIRVAIGTASADEAVWGLRRELAIAAAFALIAAIVLSYIISWLMTRSIGRLRDGVRAIAGGQLDKRLLWKPADELGEIAASIDRMADQLRQQLDETTAEKERLEAVLGSMAEGVLVIDGDKRIVLANPRFRELFSVWGETDERPLGEVLRNADLDAALSSAPPQGERSVREIELGGPEPRRVLIHSIQLPADNSRTGTVAVFHDVTEIRHLEEVRSDFIANASHELRTPITSIRGFAETLLTTPSTDDVAPYLRVIQRNAERLSNLVSDLLELSRIESQKAPLRPVQIELVEIVRQLADDLAPRLAETQLKVAIDSDDKVFAFADRHAAERILTNLIDNAIKYSNPIGEIHISIHQKSKRALVEISDQGIGIPEEDQPRVFERFYRVDRARSRSLGGTGLGLSIVKHLVQSMGGDIQLSSEFGVGSCFRFTLPAAEEKSD